MKNNNSRFRTRAELDVTALSLNHKESKRVDEYGNRFRYRAKVRDERRARVGRGLAVGRVPHQAIKRK
jgi:hypothetical protein